MRMLTAVALSLILSRSLPAQPVTNNYVGGDASAEARVSAPDDDATPERLRTSAYAAPRVFVESAGTTADRNGSEALGRHFASRCDGIQVTLNEQRADDTVALNRSAGLFSLKASQLRIVSKNGELMTQSVDMLSPGGGVKKACSSILHHWQSR